MASAMQDLSPSTAPSSVHDKGSFVERAGLAIDPALVAFVEDEVVPGTSVDAGSFWAGLASLAKQYTQANRDLLAERERMQTAIDGWHEGHSDRNSGAPESFLREIGYLVDEPAPFEIGTANTDREIATTHAPQLVVPVLNARFLLNAANARWGSLYDALYGTDALDGSLPPAGPSTGGLDPDRAKSVVHWGREFLDAVVPLKSGSWHDWEGGIPVVAAPAQLVGWTATDLLLEHNGLHIELVIDRCHPVGKTDNAGIADIVLEAATTAIVDLEDSVAAVDAEDKLLAYRNWLGLMQGTLEAQFDKGGKQQTRTLAPDRKYYGRDGRTFILPGRSLLLVRNVGHLMTTPAVLLPDGSEMFEGILDAAVTSTIALHDGGSDGKARNSREGSIYIVKPKMHGPAECAYTNDLFNAVEDMLGLERHTIKVGVMDEERRTSANLAACIHAVRERIFFINTGFLDRTGDEIHTSMQAGPMLRKGDIKAKGWIAAYENRNVQIGLACGFAGKAQIGKGMWAAPDNMQAMLTEKIGHPQSAASTAWVPSPTAAVLHATHYHHCNVAERQEERKAEAIAGLNKLLDVPLAPSADWSPEEVREELDNNVQGLLGYVVRWIDSGVGCSKVPDIHGTGLMEDRATLRISSQHLANWLLHGVISENDIDEALARMAELVDEQNAADPTYQPMVGRNAPCLPIEAARSLIFEGADQPSGYTEPLLHAFRKQAKLQV